jgi:hypothetical protein
VLRAEPATGAAEAADHFIGDQQDAVLVDDPLDLRPISRRRNNDAARALDRLADERGNLVRADLQNLFFERAGRDQPELIRR